MIEMLVLVVDLASILFVLILIYTLFNVIPFAICIYLTQVKIHLIQKS